MGRKKTYSHDPLLPIEPIRALVAEYMDAGGDLRWLAEEAGVSERMLWRIRNESEQIRLDKADQILIALDHPMSMVYPYEEAAA